MDTGNGIQTRGSKRANDAKRQRDFAIQSCETGLDHAGFKIEKVNDYVGFGVFVDRPFDRGDFLLEYKGELINNKEALKREILYKADKNIGNFLYFFRYQNKILCVDATRDDLSAGRMVNDASPKMPEENACMKIIVVNKMPHLCLFAKRDIQEGEELRYDYGVPGLPWRTRPKKKRTCESSLCKKPNEAGTQCDGASHSLTGQPEVPIHCSVPLEKMNRTAENNNSHSKNVCLIEKGHIAETGDMDQDSLRKQQPVPLKKPNSISENNNSPSENVCLVKGGPFEETGGMVCDTRRKQQPEGPIQCSVSFEKPNNISENNTSHSQSMCLIKDGHTAEAGGMDGDNLQKQQPEDPSHFIVPSEKPNRKAENNNSHSQNVCLIKEGHIAETDDMDQDSLRKQQPEDPIQCSVPLEKPNSISENNSSPSENVYLVKDGPIEEPGGMDSDTRQKQQLENPSQCTVPFEKPSSTADNSNSHRQNLCLIEEGHVEKTVAIDLDSFQKQQPENHSQYSVHFDKTNRTAENNNSLSQNVCLIKEGHIAETGDIEKDSLRKRQPENHSQYSVHFDETNRTAEYNNSLRQNVCLIKEGHIAETDDIEKDSLRKRQLENPSQCTVPFEKPSSTAENSNSHRPNVCLIEEGHVDETVAIDRGSIQKQQPENHSQYSVHFDKTNRTAENNNSLRQNMCLIKEGHIAESVDTEKDSLRKRQTKYHIQWSVPLEKPNSISENNNSPSENVCLVTDGFIEETGGMDCDTRQNALAFPYISACFSCIFQQLENPSQCTVPFEKPSSTAENSNSHRPNVCLIEEGHVDETVAIDRGSFQKQQPENHSQYSVHFDKTKRTAENNKYHIQWSLPLEKPNSISENNNSPSENVCLVKDGFIEETGGMDWETRQNQRHDDSIQCSVPFEEPNSTTEINSSHSQSVCSIIDEHIAETGDMNCENLRKLQLEDPSQCTVPFEELSSAAENRNSHGQNVCLIDEGYTAETCAMGRDSFQKQQPEDPIQCSVPFEKPNSISENSTTHNEQVCLVGDRPILETGDMYLDCRRKRVSGKTRIKSGFEEPAKRRHKTYGLVSHSKPYFTDSDQDDFIENSSGSEYRPASDEYESSGDSNDTSSEVIPLYTGKEMFKRGFILNSRKRPQQAHAQIQDNNKTFENSTSRSKTVVLYDRSAYVNQETEENILKKQKQQQPLTNTIDVTDEQYKTKNSSDEPDILYDRTNQTSVREQRFANVNRTNNAICRKYDKKFYCLYCGEPKSKLKDHFNSKHETEEDVIKLNELKENDGHKESKLFEKLRNLGNHLHNRKVLQTGQGELIVRYRPSGEANVDDYGPCPYCYGYFLRWDLWRHKCRHKPENEERRRRGQLAVFSSFLLPQTTHASKLLQGVISNMRKDEISRIAKSDQIIVAFGEKLCSKHGHENENHNYIRQKMRELARLLQEIRKQKKNPDLSLIQCIDPQMFRIIVESSKSVAAFDESSNRYGTPSLALKIGHSLQKCIKIVIARGIETGNKDMLNKAEELLRLTEINWTDEVSANALKTLQEEKRNKSQMIPLTEDVKLLSDFLHSQANSQSQKLSSCSDVEQIKCLWMSLSEITLTQTILFNRRRSGEVSKMKVKDYTAHHQADIDCSMATYLTDLEKQLCKTLFRVEIDGKRGRTVPVLFPSQVKQNIDLLNSKRLLVAEKENPFLFPRLNYGSMSHIRGTDCLRKFAEDCGASAPDRLRSTKLRKQIATMSQVINLKENELDILANFLGHDIRTHREFYRLPEATVQIAKVSKLLLSMEQGGKGLEMGQSLDDISLNEEEQVLEEDASGSASSCSESEREVRLQENPTNSADDGPEELPAKKRRLRKRQWSQEEQSAVLKHLEKFILLNKLPGKKDIDSCIVSEPVLTSRSWKNIKDFCRNKIVASKRK